MKFVLRLLLALAQFAVMVAAPVAVSAADLTITAANVVPATGYQFTDGVAGETITRGQTVYLKASDSRWWKSQADGTSAESTVIGIALQDAGAGQPLRVQTGGDLGVGAILTVGQVYVVSATAGGIAPYSDLASTNYVSILGVASSTSNLKLKIFATAVAKP